MDNFSRLISRIDRRARRLRGLRLATIGFSTAGIASLGVAGLHRLGLLAIGPWAIALLFGLPFLWLLLLYPVGTRRHTHLPGILLG